MAIRLARWKSPEGRQAYLTAYEEAMTLWPVPFESKIIATRFGDTHAVVSGQADAPPLLLLPAAIGTGGLQWFPNAAGLAAHHRIYAIDFVGAPGKGSQTAAMLDKVDYANWLVDLLDQLSIDRANIVGSSQGGWMTLNAAEVEPSRVNAIALLAPAASLLPFRKPVEFMIRIGPWMPAWTAAGTIRFSFGSGYRVDERFSRVAELALKHFRYQEGALMPMAFSDDELRKVTARVRVMIGDHERIYDPQVALERARRLIPNVETELVANAGHLLNMEQADHVDARVVDFIQQVGHAGPSSET
jgi:pimeloyl-ACP methyl ester carboxylesterase